MILGLLSRLKARFERASEQRRLRQLISVPTSSRLNYLALRLQPGAMVQIGVDSLVDGTLITELPNASITIGQRTFMNGTLIAADSVHVGDDVLIAWGVTVVDHDSHSVVFSSRCQDVADWARSRKDWKSVKRSPVRIESKAWIGFNSIILKGVHVGEGAIVGAGSVVTRNVPPWTIVAGNPAKIIRELGPDER